MTASELPLADLLLLFERCLEEDPAHRLQVARQLCQDRPEFLEPLLGLLERDRTLDQAGLQTSPDFSRLSRLALSERWRRGQIVGPFRIEDCIGTGGMGTVYRVRRIDGHVDQEAALKVLSPDRVNPLLIDRFSRERQVLASLEHPGICRFLDAGTLPDGQPYVLMELVKGRPLLQYCDQAALTVRQRVELFVSIADTVEHAHRRLVVHRDIKSENILVDDQGQPKLLDFGIAKDLSGDEGWEQTQTTERFLTPRTAAPEQLLGDPVGVACDIYALGQLLYELLCGQSPFDFEGLRPSEVEQLILKQPPPPMVQRCPIQEPAQWRSRGFAHLGQWRRALRGDLEAIVLKCLRKRPDNRYPSVEQLSSDLRHWMDGRPIRLRSRDRSYRFWKFLARNRLAVGLTTGLFSTLLLSSFFLAWQSVNLERERSTAILERDRARYAIGVLQQAFESADPAGSLGADVKAGQILEAARRPVLELRHSQPDLFVSLALVLSEVELALRQNQSAAEMAELALEMASRTDVSLQDERNLLMVKARSLTNSRDREQADAALARVREIDLEVQPDWLHAKGRLALLNDQRELAQQLLTRSIGLYQDAGIAFEEAARAFWDHAISLSQAGRHDEALASFERLVSRATTELTADHPTVSLTRLYQIEALVRAAEVEGAAQIAELIRDDILRWYGEDSPMAGRLHGTLGMLELRRDDPQRAAFHYRAARSIWLRHFSPGHPDLLRVSINLGFALNFVSGGDLEAERVYRETLEGIVEQGGASQRTELLVRGLLAELLGRQERFREALEALLEPESLDLELAAEVRQWRQALQTIVEGPGCVGVGARSQITRRCQDAAGRLSS